MFGSDIILVRDGISGFHVAWIRRYNRLPSSKREFSEAAHFPEEGGYRRRGFGETIHDIHTQSV
jgi:hypothetical protein